MFYHVESQPYCQLGQCCNINATTCIKCPGYENTIELPSTASDAFRLSWICTKQKLKREHMNCLLLSFALFFTQLLPVHKSPSLSFHQNFEVSSSKHFSASVTFFPPLSVVLCLVITAFASPWTSSQGDSV